MTTQELDVLITAPDSRETVMLDYDYRVPSHIFTRSDDVQIHRIRVRAMQAILTGDIDYDDLDWRDFADGAPLDRQSALDVLLYRYPQEADMLRYLAAESLSDDAIRIRYSARYPDPALYPPHVLPTPEDLARMRGMIKESRDIITLGI